MKEWLASAVFLYALAALAAVAFIGSEDKYDLPEAFALSVLWPVAVVVLAWRALRRP